MVEWREGTAAGRAAEVADRKFWSCCAVAIVG